MRLFAFLGAGWEERQGGELRAGIEIVRRLEAMRGHRAVEIRGEPQTVGFRQVLGEEELGTVPEVPIDERGGTAL
jgi:hypothetical protein